MTPIPGYSPPGSTAEASEASGGNTFAHSSNGMPEEDTASGENVLTPTPEAFEASGGNLFNAFLATTYKDPPLSAGNFLVTTGTIHEEMQDNENPPTGA